MKALRAKAFLLALVLVVMPATAGMQDLAPGEGRISLSLDGHVEEPLRHRRTADAGVICEFATWDNGSVFGEVSHCEVVGDRYWRPGRIDIGLLLATFPFLGDVMLAAPAPRLELATAIGRATLYGFAVDDASDEASHCVGLVKGYAGAGNGYREVLVAYACIDGPLDDARAEALMQGLAIEGSFRSLLP